MRHNVSKKYVLGEGIQGGMGESASFLHAGGRQKQFGC